MLLQAIVLVVPNETDMGIVEDEMTWNYRVLRRNDDETLGQDSYTIHEVYYDDGKPTSCSAREVSPFGETLEELKEDMEHYCRALQEPVLDYADFETKVVPEP